MMHDFSSCPPEMVLWRKHLVTRGNSFASLCKPNLFFLILRWKSDHRCLFYADILIQFLELEILSDSACESLCYFRHIPDLNLLEEIKKLLPPLFSSGYTVGSSILQCGYKAAQPPANSGLCSPLSAYCSSCR